VAIPSVAAMGERVRWWWVLRVSGGGGGGGWLVVVVNGGGEWWCWAFRQWCVLRREPEFQLTTRLSAVNKTKEIQASFWLLLVSLSFCFLCVSFRLES